jgi:NADH:ubiquinone oxidoreductase subunit 5 (subunit L)/multisubunit Na+/H+ antiporter MnhA subunit
LFGRLFAILEVSVKKLVAYSTLSQIGLGILVYGVGQYNLGFYHLIVHGIAKCLLFIQVGYLIHLR